MPYILNSDQKSLLGDSYCSLTNFKKFVQKLRHCAFNAYSNRELIRVHLEELEMAAPFNENCRFPNNYHIHLVGSFQTNYMFRLRFFIDELKDKRILDAFRIQQFFDILNEFEKVCDIRSRSELLKLNIFDRTSFEEHYGLFWCEPDDREDNKQEIISFE